ncbi:MAG: epoxide hydrolase [Chitinophagales bacterium]|nr:MAG: epoxide hydrolase [Chitinophagales bacterium]
MRDFEHHYAQVNGIRLHYVAAGNGPLVILLHGFPEFWYAWHKQLPALARHFRVIAPDLRGYGDSDKPKAISNYSAKVIARDIVELIHALGETKAHIVGHDWGGAIAYMMAQHFPQSVSKLIVLNCPLPQLLLKSFFTNFSQLKKSWYMFFFQLPQLPERYIGKDLRTFFYRGLRGWAHNKEAFTKEDIEEYVKAYQKPYAITGAVNYYRAAFRDGLKKEIRSITPIQADTLVIWGEDDKALGKELTYGMEKHFQNHFEIKYIPDCSHWVQHEYPDKVNQLILNFIKKETAS